MKLRNSTLDEQVFLKRTATTWVYQTSLECPDVRTAWQLNGKLVKQHRV